MPRYTISEPHPTVPQNSYIHSGRGGAGNFFRAPLTTPSEGVPTQASTAPLPPSGRFYSGRGGAGNAHQASERAVMSFDEEYTRAEREASSMGHVGRGGAGNVMSTGSEAAATRMQSVSSSRRDSASTTGSTKSSKSGFWGRLSSGSLGRH